MIALCKIVTYRIAIILPVPKYILFQYQIRQRYNVVQRTTSRTWFKTPHSKYIGDFGLIKTEVQR